MYVKYTTFRREKYILSDRKIYVKYIIADKFRICNENIFQLYNFLSTIYVKFISYTLRIF